ncbi:MAG TPA: 2Fe-2S iron-sulfur cluster binding domain-containing protein [Hyphomicrobiaceae bacterium]|nr:2Fe-2S iron-sulfur cluster binding domain-containing protein [Hyphomicrobiaceae bacterium]
MSHIFGDPFEVLLIWSERTLTVASHQTALEVLVAAGVPIEPGCMTGGCGACATRFVDGDLIHNDTCLSAADRATHFCPCVSRARGVLVLPF